MKSRKILSVLLSLCILSAATIPTSAVNTALNDKQIFVDNLLSTINIAQPIDVETHENINDVLVRFISNDIAGVMALIGAPEDTTKSAKTTSPDSVYTMVEEYLNKNNVYIYSYETNAVNVGRSVGSTDVHLNSVMISYSASDDKWIVTGGGYWANANYKQDAPPPTSTVHINVGGQDAVGFSLIGTSGNTPTLHSSFGYIHDGHGHNTTLNYPYNSDSSKGLVFQYQDQVYLSDDGSDTWYMGYGFAASGTYNGDFANYHGRARSYYAHTWDICSINSIGISVDGFSASWSNSAYGWNIYSNSDVAF